MQIPTDPSDPDSYFKGTRGHKGFNVTKIAALFDLNDRSYADAIVRGKGVANENRLLVEMVKRSDFYHSPFQIVRFRLTERTYEVLVTNPDPEEFMVSGLKKLYARRWGVRLRSGR